MKKFIFILSFILFFNLLNAQEFADKEFYLVDSLVLKDIDPYSLNQIDSVLHLYHNTSDDTIKLSYIDFLVSNLGDIDILWKYNDFMFFKATESLAYTNNIITKNRLHFYIATHYGNKGILYSFVNENDSTFLYFNKALDIFTEINDLSGIANMEGAIGTCYDFKGDIKQALYYFNKSLKTAELSGKVESIAMALLDIASIQREYKEYDKALENGLRAIDYNLLEKSQQGIIKGYLFVGTIYYEMGDLENAKTYSQNSIEVAEKTNNDYWIIDGNVLLGKVFYGLEELDSSKYYYSLAMKEAELINAEDTKMVALHGLAKITLSKEDYINAELFAREAYDIAKNLNSKTYISKSAEILSKVLEKNEDFGNALEYFHIHNTYKDSVYNSDNQKDAIRLGIQYDFEKEVALVEQEKVFAQELAAKNQKLFIASIIGGGSLFLLALFFIYQLQLKKRAELAEVKLTESENKFNLERKLNDAEMKALKSQMNPHFLFNAFNSIQEFIILNNRELASDYLGKFADLMRLYLDHSREKRITLENEISATSLYLELEKIRFEDTLTYAIEVAGNIDTSMVELPPMLIQPFIENSLKHGLLHKKENRQLKVNFEEKDNALICSIEDNGIGRKQSTLLNEKRVKKHKSFATSATQNRIELLNVGREKEIMLQIIDLEDDNGYALGTKVEIRIPLIM